eukprot:4981723-Pyramimonas_sp.AAC.1
MGVDAEARPPCAQQHCARGSVIRAASPMPQSASAVVRGAPRVPRGTPPAISNDRMRLGP